MNSNQINDDNIGNSVQDKLLQCQDCAREFPHTARDQEFFESLGYTDQKRCKPCRQARKSTQQPRY